MPELFTGILEANADGIQFGAQECHSGRTPSWVVVETVLLSRLFIEYIPVNSEIRHSSACQYSGYYLLLVYGGGNPSKHNRPVIHVLTFFFLLKVIVPQ